MLTLPIRVLLIVGSLATILFMLWRIRHSKVQIKDSIFWLVFGLLLFILSIFPRLTFFISDSLGFLSPINFVYLFIIFILLIQQFSSALRISRLDARVQQLAQRLALEEKAKEDAQKAAGAKTAQPRPGGPAR